MTNLVFKRRLVIFLATMLIVSLLSSPVAAFASTTTSSVPNIPTFTTSKSASNFFYNQLFDHQKNIKFVYVTTNGNASSVSKFFKDQAFIDKASSSSLLGDYVRYNLYNGYKVKYSYYKSNGKYYYTFNYTVSYRTTLSQDNQFEAKLSSAVSSLKLSGKTQYQKVKAIYDYICRNVKYDYKNSSTYYQKYTAYAALVNKTSVCQGYANLFYRMCKKAGIPVRIVTGWSKSQNHAWNIVSINGKYYNVDATWDAGKSTYSYFLKSNATFKDHKRNSEYTTSSFNRSHPMSTKSYYVISTTQPNVTVKKAASTSATISWSKCTNASGYKIYRATKKNGTYSRVATVSNKSSKYVNKKLAKKKYYYYKVKAYQKVNGTLVYSKISAGKAVRL